LNLLLEVNNSNIPPQATNNQLSHFEDDTNLKEEEDIFEEKTRSTAL
jgi:hypothetical protein